MRIDYCMMAWMVATLCERNNLVELYYPRAFCGIFGTEGIVGRFRISFVLLILFGLFCLGGVQITVICNYRLLMSTLFMKDVLSCLSRFPRPYR